MKPLKAKDLITGNHLHEAEPAEGDLRRGPQPPAGSTGEPRRPMRMPGGGPRGMGGMGGMGRPPGPPRMFAGPEEGGLKDIMLLFLTEVAGNSYDAAIVRKMIDGKDLDRGELQHVLDEGARIQNLPESHVKILERIHSMLQNMPA